MTCRQEADAVQALMSGGPGQRVASLPVTCCVVSHKQFHLVRGRYCSAGGFNKYMEVLAAMFDRVVLAVPVDREVPAEDVTPLKDGIASVVEVPTYRLRYPLFWLIHPVGLGRPILSAIRQADVVHVVFPGYVQIVGLFLARLKRRPVFCSLVGDWEAQWAVSRVADAHPWLIRLLMAASRIVVRWVLRSRLVFVHGRSLADKYRRMGGRVVENQSSTFCRADIRREEDLAPLHDPPRLLFVGRLDYKKGVPVLLEAVAKLRAAGLPTALTVVGSGPNQREFEHLCRELGLAEAVTFRGHIGDRPTLWEVYREHDLFVLPSLTEGAPKVVVEAFAHGLPIVATRVGGIPGLVSADSGILVPPGDADALAQGIRRILTDNELRLTLGRANLRVAAGKTMEVQVAHMERHIREAFPELFGTSGLAPAAGGS